jgi:hypothetical protein
MTYGAVAMAAEHLNKTAANWATDRGLSLWRLLVLDDSEFDRLKADPLTAMDDSVRAFVEAHKNNFDAGYHAAELYELENPGRSGELCQQVLMTFSA